MSISMLLQLLLLMLGATCSSRLQRGHGLWRNRLLLPLLLLLLLLGIARSGLLQLATMWLVRRDCLRQLLQWLHHMGQ